MFFPLKSKNSDKSYLQGNVSFLGYWCESTILDFT